MGIFEVTPVLTREFEKAYKCKIISSVCGTISSTFSNREGCLSLALPNSISIHPVFHAFQLRNVVGHTMLLIPFPPNLGDNLMILVSPVELLGL